MAAEDNNIMIHDGHFDIGSTKESRTCNIVSSSLLGLKTKALKLSKGIKLQPGEVFDFKKLENDHIYIFEAGLDPLHAQSVRSTICIYVIWQGQELLVGTLSSAHSRMPLDLMMTTGLQLYHTGLRKPVYFNAFEFKPMALKKSSLIDTKKKLWVTTVKPYETAAFDPVNHAKKYHLLKVFATPTREETIDLHIQYDGKSEKIGSLSFDDAQYPCSIEFDDKFSLSHTSKATNVTFYGYMAPYEHDSTLFELKELPCGDTSKLIIKAPKEPQDPEYVAFKAKEARKGKKEAKKERAQATREKLLVQTPLPLIPHKILWGSS